LDLNNEEIQKEGDILKKIRHYLVGNTAYGDTGVRDVYLELKNIKIGARKGNLHFIRFPTHQMQLFLDLCVTRKLHTLTFQVFATGGGAFKFESEVTQRLCIGWNKCDELDMLISGVEILNDINMGNECYFFQIEYLAAIVDNKKSWNHGLTSQNTKTNNDDKTNFSNCRFTKKNFCFSKPYPYILVNIGSGVSVLLVKSETDFQRISGTSIGGGTFLGLCCLLTGCTTYEEAIDMATRGDSNKVDKLVRDIYGGDYSRFGLPGDIVASSFGNMCYSKKRENASKEDLAKSTLLTILNNIGLIARDCATNYVINANYNFLIS
jgi:type II pantothenate kinase